MGFINERPEFDMDLSWSETGDRYLVKLFRDYVFHQVDENGHPVVDMVHVLTCLNKVNINCSHARPPAKTDIHPFSLVGRRY